MNGERSGSRSARARAGGDLPKKKPDLKKVMPEIWKLIRPRRWLLAFGFLLMLINRVAGLVLPFSTKFLIDRVLPEHGGNPKLLMPLAGLVFTTTAIQAVTSFSLTQLLSKAAQRMITELRQQVQQHVGRLSVAFYDANRTGLLVSRIMNDVEGVRNLMGTGLVEFVGGMLTASLVFAYLVYSNTRMTLIVFAVVGIFVVVLQRAFKTIRPIFRERAKITGEVTGRLTESLGGVRVVKGYHAEKREAGVFTVGVTRLLDNVMKSLTATSLLSLAATTVLGVVGGLVMLIGGHQVMQPSHDDGRLLPVHNVAGVMIAPIFQIVNIGTQLTEAVAGLDRTMEILGEKDEFADPARVRTLDEIVGEVRFDDVEFAYEKDKPVLHGIRSTRSRER